MIRFNNYAITADNLQFKLSEIKVAGGDAKNAGEEMLINTTFHTTMNGLFSALAKKELLSATDNANTLNELTFDFLARMSAIESELTAIARGQS